MVSSVDFDEVCSWAEDVRNASIKNDIVSPFNVERKEKILQLLLSEGYQVFVENHSAMTITALYLKSDREFGQVSEFVYNIGNKSIDEEIAIFKMSLYNAAE